MKMQTHQLERMNKDIEVRKSRRENIDLRNQWMRAKPVKNYQT